MPVTKRNTEALYAPLGVMAAPDFNTDEVLIHAGSLLKGSGHPLEEAVLALIQAQGIALLPAAHVDCFAGKGWMGRVNGKICVLGEESLMAEAGIDIAYLQAEQAASLSAETAHFFLSIGDHLAGLLVRHAPR
jgi:cation transport ATPase